MLRGLSVRSETLSCVSCLFSFIGQLGFGPGTFVCCVWQNLFFVTFDLSLVPHTWECEEWGGPGSPLREGQNTLNSPSPAATVGLWGATNGTATRKDPDWRPPARPSWGWKLRPSSLGCAALQRKRGARVEIRNNLKDTFEYVAKENLTLVCLCVYYRHPCGGRREQLWVGSRFACWASSPSAGRRGWADSLAQGWTRSWLFPAVPTQNGKIIVCQ